MSVKPDSTRTAIIDPNYFYQPIETVPLGKKVLLLTKGRVAVLGHINRDDMKYYLGWSPLPKIPKEME